MPRSIRVTTVTRGSAGSSARSPYVEVKDVPGPTGESAMWVRLKPTAAKSAKTR